MTAPDRLQVHVNDELVLDAGACEHVEEAHGPEWLIHRPKATLFHQVLAYLETKPAPPARRRGTIAGRDGVAAAALVLRWGSYLAVLLDRRKPLWPAVREPTTGRISDDEMARINIEASAALAEWIDIYRQDRDRYGKLVDLAIAHLPMPNTTSEIAGHTVALLAEPEIAKRLVAAADLERVRRVRSDARRWPSRILANALVNTAWRNGPVEDLHAGRFRGYPLAQRRMTAAEERTVMRFASDGLALAMSVCLTLTTERSRRSWPEQVLPFGLAELLTITPARWTLTESSREIRLPA